MSRFSHLLSCFSLTLTIISLIQKPPSVNSARILVYIPAISRSELFIHSAIAATLAEVDDYDVTVISTLPNVHKNAAFAKYIQIEVPAFKMHNLSHKITDPIRPLHGYFGSMMDHSAFVTNETMFHQDMQRFLRQHTAGSFDLLILGYHANDWQLGLAGHFKCPVIVSFKLPSIFLTNRMVGNPAEIAHVPAYISGMLQPMDFFDRVKSFWFHVFERVFVENILEFFWRRQYENYFPSDIYPPLETMRKNVSLVFTNAHFSDGPIRANAPALIELGGIQIDEPIHYLYPIELHMFIDSSEHGFIYFSMGYTEPSLYLQSYVIKRMFRVLANLPYRTIWKWSDEFKRPGKSSNIFFQNFLPQNEILANPGCKLFISHGGFNSIMEAKHHAVPVLGIPIVGDQFMNIAKVVRAGYGISMEHFNMTSATFHNNIIALTQNRKYKIAAQKESAMFHQRPLSAQKLVRFWVDYVLTNNGAMHMQSPAVHLNKLEYISIDIVAFTIILLIVSLYISVVMYRFYMIYTGPLEDLAELEAAELANRHPCQE